MSELLMNYLACWNETDAVARRALIDRHWAEQATYVDPMADVAGRDAVSATIGAVQDQFPNSVFMLVGGVDAHHNQVRFQWGLGPVGAEPVVIGFDVVVTGEDGRIESVHGFLDRVPG
ncbi:MAG: nuclear transport factor 2 family protein [Jatrophihabitans sp.]